MNARRTTAVLGTAAAIAVTAGLLDRENARLEKTVRENRAAAEQVIATLRRDAERRTRLAARDDSDRLPNTAAAPTESTIR